MFEAFGVIVGTSLYVTTSTDRFANTSILLTCVRSAKWEAMFKSLLSDQGSPRISIPIGTPIGASAVYGEKPAGIVTTGNPVRATSIPLRPN